MSSSTGGASGGAGMDLGTPPTDLPGLPRPPARSMKGPTPWCNWVIKGHVLAGAYPASMDDRDTEDILTTLLEAGVCTFVCLQAEVSLSITEAQWRTGHGLRPYIKDAQRILSKAHQVGNPRITLPKIDFLHLPIIDGSVTSDEAIMRLRDDCCHRIINGEKLYIHCWGGHGRTGTLVCLILSKLYGLTPATALHLCQAYHDSRKFPQHVRSPQTAIQRAQVQRVLSQYDRDSKQTRRSSAPQEYSAPTGATMRKPAATRTSHGRRYSDLHTPVGSLSSRNNLGRAGRQPLSSDQVASELHGLCLEGSSAARHREHGYLSRASKSGLPRLTSEADSRGQQNHRSSRTGHPLQLSPQQTSSRRTALLA